MDVALVTMVDVATIFLVKALKSKISMHAQLIQTNRMNEMAKINVCENDIKILLLCRMNRAIFFIFVFLHSKMVKRPEQNVHNTCGLVNFKNTTFNLFIFTVIRRNILRISICNFLYMNMDS